MSTGKIYSAIPAIMAEVGPIAKARKNQGQGYNFRGVDDVYAALQLILAKHKVFTVPEVISSSREERTTKNGGLMIYSILRIKYTIFAEDGSFVTATVEGEGMDSGDKASNKGLSIAHKYLFLQLFCIPTEDAKDPENDSHELEPKGKDKGPEPLLISDAQRKRLFAIANKSNIPDENVKAILAKHGFESSKDITWQKYDEIVRAVESYTDDFAKMT